MVVQGWKPQLASNYLHLLYLSITGIFSVHMLYFDIKSPPLVFAHAPPLFPTTYFLSTCKHANPADPLHCHANYATSSSHVCIHLQFCISLPIQTMPPHQFNHLIFYFYTSFRHIFLNVKQEHILFFFPLVFTI